MLLFPSLSLQRAHIRYKNPQTSNAHIPTPFCLSKQSEEAEKQMVNIME